MEKLVNYVWKKSTSLQSQLRNNWIEEQNRLIYKKYIKLPTTLKGKKNFKGILDSNQLEQLIISRRAANCFSSNS